MFSLKVKTVMVQEACVVVDPQSTVDAAAQAMVAANVGAAMVVADGVLKGVFTERDALCRVTAPALDPHQTLVADVMTTTPRSVAPDNSFGYALQLMHAHGLRQLPVLDAGRLLGVVWARDALDPALEEFVAEAQRREGYCNERPREP